MKFSNYLIYSIFDFLNWLEPTKCRFQRTNSLDVHFSSRPWSDFESGFAVWLGFKRFQTIIFNWPQNSFYLTLSSIKYSLDNYQLVFSVYSWSFLIIINQTFQGQFLMSNLPVFDIIQWCKLNLQSFSTRNPSIKLGGPKPKTWPIWPKIIKM